LVLGAGFFNQGNMRSIIAEVMTPELNQSLSRVYNIITDMEGNTLSVNDAFFRVMDMPREKLFNQPFISFLQGADITLSPSNLSSLFINNSFTAFVASLYTAKKPGPELQWTVTQLHTKDQDILLQWSAEECRHPQKNGETPSAHEIYTSLFNDSPQIMWIYDRETLQFLDVNVAAIARYGY
jgi:PAS domain-containing protein